MCVIHMCIPLEELIFVTVGIEKNNMKKNEHSQHQANVRSLI